jgi:NADPH2:quinone reductase
MRQPLWHRRTPIVDYREGDDAVRSAIKAASKGTPIHHAYDAVSDSNPPRCIESSAEIHIASLLGHGIVGMVNGCPLNRTMVGSVHMAPAEGQALGDKEFGAAFFPFIGQGLA